MVLSIKDPEADRLARAVAERTGETLTQAVIGALREKLERAERERSDVDARVADALEIARHYSSLPILDNRSPDEILGYDEHGIPK
jgi:antitoxin VapB